MKYTVYFLAFFFLFSCGQDLTSIGSGNSGRGSASSSNSALTCSCGTQENYVCGTNGQVTMTFLNGCIAQCNGFTYSSGSCEANLQNSCDSSNTNVCGQPPCTGAVCPSPILYSNECAMINAGASPVDNSQCSQ